MWLSTTDILRSYALFLILFASLLQVESTIQEDGNEFGVEELDQILEKGEEHLKLLDKLELESREKFPASNRRRGHIKRKQPSQYAHSFYNESIIFQVATKELMKNAQHRKKRDVAQMNFEKANEYVVKRVREKRSKKEWSILWPGSCDSKQAEEFISELGTCDPNARYRTFNGRCNNLKYPNNGAKDERQLRLLPPSYADGVSEPRKYGKYGGLLPNPRRISLNVHTEEDNLDQQYNLFVMQWGQFEDHDLVISPEVKGLGGGSLECPCGTDHPECFNIPFPPGDNSHPSLKCFDFVRSLPHQSHLGTREQINGNTAYLDASTVYGNDACEAQQLRSPGGFLKTTEDNKHKSLLPLVTTRHECLARNGECFMAGEGRVNEQPGLTSLHTVFVREHNTIVSKLTQMNPQWDEEKLYQEARKIVAAFNQHITFNEFLPRVLGPSNILEYKLDLVTTGYYKGYDQECDAGILNEFATAAYRFGHSLIRNHLALFSPGRHGRSVSEIALHRHFDNPDLMKNSVNMDHLLRGLLLTPMQKFDSNVASELTERLFPKPADPFSGSDLMALNIQRGRDHGLPSYVHYRKLCKLDVHLLESFEDLRDYMDDVVVERLKSVYTAVEDIDFFTGGMSEKTFGGAMVGPTFACIIGIQYMHLRKCDRFWYENDFSDTKFSEDQLREIRGTTLSALICRNLENPHIEEIPKFGFDQVSSSNPLVNCITGDIQHFDPEPWREGGIKVDGCSSSLSVSAEGTDVHFLSGVWENHNQYEGRPVYKMQNAEYYLFYSKNRWVVEPEIGRHVDETKGSELFGIIRFEGDVECPENVGARWYQKYTRQLEPRISITSGGFVAQTILIESMGGAARSYGSALGYFDKTQETFNGRHVYKQTGGIHFLYHYVVEDKNDAFYGSWWQVSSTLGGYDAFLYVMSKDLEPPATGWKYYTDREHFDSTLRLSTSPTDFRGERAATILLESSGGAAEYHGGRLGYYDKTEEILTKRPVYKQRGGDQYLYYYEETGRWQVYSTVGGSSKALYVTSTAATPAATGWQYYTSAEGWLTDSTLRVDTSPSDPSSTCTSIKVAATGPAGSAQGSKMGNYEWEGDWRNGRKVFRGGRDGDQYLRVFGPTWGIYSSRDSGGAGIGSGRGTTCPCSPAAGSSDRLGVDWWRYSDGEWHVDRSISVTCV